MIKICTSCRDLKDKNIFKAMLELLQPGLDPKRAQSLLKEASTKVKNSGGHSASLRSFCETLCARVWPGLLPEIHLKAVLERISDHGTDDELGNSLSILVVDAAAANGHLFALLGGQVHIFVTAENSHCSGHCLALDSQLTSSVTLTGDNMVNKRRFSGIALDRQGS